MEEKKKFYTVYRITNLLNEMIYIGQHVTKNLNDGYMGSSKYLSKDIKEFGLEKFKKEILFIFDTKEEMIAKEKELVNKEFVKRIDTYNRSQGGCFNVSGQVTVKDKDGNTLMVSTQDPRFLNKELISIFKNKISVKDKNNNVFKIFKNDPKYLSGELKPFFRNKIGCFDKNGKMHFVEKNDIRLKNKDFII